VNAVTSPHFAWVIFPAFGMLMGLTAKWRPLGDAGVSFFDVIQRRQAIRNAGVEGSVPAVLFSNSLAGRARRFASRLKVAGVSWGISAAAFLVGAPLHIKPLIVPWVVGGVIAAGALISAARAAAPLRRLGFRRRDLLKGTWRDSEAARAPGTAFRLREEEVSQLAPPDVVMSAHGERLRQAVDDRTAIRQQMARLDGDHRSILPDVLPTVEALVARIASIAGALHQLDRDMGSAGDGSLDSRISELRARGLPESDSTLSLLVRQRQSLSELEGRRGTLRSQLESATITLQNLRLDVLRLGSMGLESPAVRDVGQATEQARALSRDLAYLLEGAREAERT
jgi:serine/threonine-protein kinase